MDETARALPASATKHEPRLLHPLPGTGAVVALRQLSASAGGDAGGPARGGPTGETGTGQTGATGTGTTGTTLWLGAQVLAAYLSLVLPAPALLSEPSAPSASAPTAPAAPTVPAAPAAPARRPRVLDLGAGVGLLALSLAAAGYDVLATDVEPVLSAVLRGNVEAGQREVARVAGPRAGRVAVAKLDWFDVGRARLDLRAWYDAAWPPDADADAAAADAPDAARRGFDLIVTSDTIYDPALVPALWSTVCRASALGPRAPAVYLALERRDPRLVDAALAAAGEAGVELRKAGRGRVGKALKGWAWDDEDWAGVEVWKGRVR